MGNTIRWAGTHVGQLYPFEIIIMEIDITILGIGRIDFSFFFFFVLVCV